jgi:hypothetical protein
MICFDAVLGRTPTGGWLPMQQDAVGQLTKHNCPNRKEQQQTQPQQQQATVTTLSDGPLLAELIDSVEELSNTINGLKGQIVALQLEVKELHKELLSKSARD